MTTTPAIEQPAPWTIYHEECECGGDFLGHSVEPCRPDCRGYLPDEKATAANAIFWNMRRAVAFADLFPRATIT